MGRILRMRKLFTADSAVKVSAIHRKEEARVSATLPERVYFFLALAIGESR